MKTFTNGTHRAVDPEQTVQAITPFLPEMGITRVANVTGLDRLDIPVVNAMRPNSRSLSVSQGKGLTLEAAKASAIMEAVESFHAEEIELPRVSGSFKSIRLGREICEVKRLPFLDGTHFDPSIELDWIEGQCLMTGKSRWVPAETVHTDYTLPTGPSAGCFVASTNGLASGNELIEAQIHGICEVIERDANTLWELSPMQSKAKTRVDLDSVTDRNCAFVIEKLRAKGMELAVWDMTSDVGVPTFYCLMIDRIHANGHSGAGAGTHPVKEIALLRALTEAVQVRTNYITGARDDLGHDEYGLEGIGLKTRNAEILLSGTNKQTKSFASVPSYEFETFDEDLEFLIVSLNSAGIEEVLCVDLSRPMFGVAVARIIIPGLEGPHDHIDYAMGERAMRYGE